MSGKYLTLVFDDGPKKPMCNIVDKIASYGWSAGFAIVGKKISDETKPYIEYAIEHKFELVSHGWNHIDLTSFDSKQDITDEILRPINEIKKNFKYNITMARLPFLTYNDLVMETMTDLKIPLLGQGIDGGEDWVRDKTPNSIANAVLNSVSDGAVACLHVTESTCKSLDIILPQLKKDGYSLVTAKRLFEIKKVSQIPFGLNITNVNLL